jgi:pimeloyl-ACP methyl ester carboxylesterase
MPFLRAGGHLLDYEWIGPAPDEAPSLVFLHQGLGCAAMWRDFAADVAAATGCGALVYSRWGHGASDPLTEPRTGRFMHDEALVTLPEVLAATRVILPILVGHSDGGSIALIYAGAGAGPVRGLVLEAPHVFVEDLSLRSIAAMKEAFSRGDLKDRLARYHGPNTEAMFRGWNDVWLSPAFRDWNIEGYLQGVTCPVLVIQGEGDEYGTPKQVEAIAEGVAGPVESVVLPECGHFPHRDHPAFVRRLVARFVRDLLPERPALAADAT